MLWACSSHDTFRIHHTGIAHQRCGIRRAWLRVSDPRAESWTLRVSRFSALGYQTQNGIAAEQRRILMAEAGGDRAHWARVAGEWTAWARAPGHDAFWAYRSSLAAFIGAGTGEALEVGCGEGRVSRELMTLGYRVTATDPVSQMVAATAQAGSAHGYAVAAAASLPFDDGRFDLVVAYNVLMDVDDVPAAVREIRRVLRPSGRVVVSIVHPMADHGRFAGDEADAPFVVEGTYFGRQRFEGLEERDGLRMHFAGWRQPLEAYTAALADAGLAITALREPVPELSDGREHLRPWTRVPLFLWLKAGVLND
jgi:SAM-dependent methyltransferase